MRYRRWLAAATGGATFLALLRRWTAHRRGFPVEVESLLDGMRSSPSPGKEAYDQLFCYFVEGFTAYRTPLGANADYPGLPSRNGLRADRLEGFSRIVPLMGAWARSGRSSAIRLHDGSLLDLCATFRQGLIFGTDPKSPEYWGHITDLNQRIIEAADIALALWFFGEQAWNPLTQEQRDNVVAWLLEVETKRVPDNNWHLFPVLIHCVLEKFGIASDRQKALSHYGRFKEFYRGNGWFSDGPGEIFDYYNAWSMHYQLYWIDQVDAFWDHGFISSTRRDFLGTYRYLFGPRGFPVIGRSVCYRMAAPVALIFGQGSDPDVVAPEEARRALDITWSTFIQRGGVRAGNVTQGLCGPDPRVLDNYSGGASCLWALRSLVAAFAIPEASAFWRKPPGKLPIECRSYTIEIPELHWTIEGNQETGSIQIHKPGLTEPPVIPLTSYTILRRIAGFLLGYPFRPQNQQAKYDFATYDSLHPFCGCRTSKKLKSDVGPNIQQPT